MTMLLAIIMTIMIFAAGCGQQTQNKKPPSDDQKTVQSSAREQTGDGTPSMEKKESLNETKKAAVSKEKSDQILDDTLNTLNELEATINSLDEVTDSDLQTAE
jgi:hypothetical protein